MPGILQDPSISPNGVLSFPDQSSPGYTIDPNALKSVRTGQASADQPQDQRLDGPMAQGILQMDPGLLQVAPVQETFGDKLQKPGVSDGLLALGAGLLSGHNFFDGLGKGAAAFGQAVDEGQRNATPQATYLANGAVVALRDPQTGRITYHVNPAVTQAMQRQNQVKVDGQAFIQDLKNSGGMDRVNRQQDGADDRNDANIDARRELAGMNNRSRENISAGRDKTMLEVAGINSDSRANVANINGGYKLDGRQAPASAVKDYNKQGSDANVTAQTVQQLDDLDQSIASGKLPLGLASNARQEIALKTGIGGNDATAEYAKWKQWKEKARNTILRGNVGTQTEGDAIRALNEITAGDRDPEALRANLGVVRQALGVAYQNSMKARKVYEDQYGLNRPKGSGASTPAAPARRAQTGGTTPSGLTWKLTGN